MQQQDELILTAATEDEQTAWVIVLQNMLHIQIAATVRKNIINHEWYNLLKVKGNNNAR